MLVAVTSGERPDQEKASKSGACDGVVAHDGVDCHVYVLVDHNQEYIDQLPRLGNDTVRLLFEADTR